MTAESDEILYRPGDISFDGTFRKGVILPLFHSQSTIIRRLEYCGGVEPNTIAQNVIVKENVIGVRPSVAPFFRMGTFTFIPDTATLNRILRATTHNLSCPPDERIGFRDIPEFADCQYTLFIRHSFQGTIHLCNPKTGQITTHRSPYPALPRFTLPCNPWIAAVAAFKHLIFRLDPPDFPLLFRIGRLVFHADLPKYFCMVPDPDPPSLADTSSSEEPLVESSVSGSTNTRKRKREEGEPNPGVAEWVRETQEINFLRLRPNDVGKYADERSTSPESIIRRDARQAPWLELAKVKCPQIVARITTSLEEEEEEAALPEVEAKRRRLC
ncbi:hypothetical protein CYLTODRAFT_421162 [Cylindrobasidium torrendii FP15055 ss-10]|uniref:Uncharacterized protein n=1 Tax=Cylindrobasidium torrendii FP15055 ss-10 TaxID=1314674 RepID=A0A0D7BFP3_9AGAR|nr:hypothetical protein CYLTODRAFT_421162 [Cylindrobasidium torrendii FP15055 ss-10]